MPRTGIGRTPASSTSICRTQSNAIHEPHNLGTLEKCMSDVTSNLRRTHSVHTRPAGPQGHALLSACMCDMPNAGVARYPEGASHVEPPGHTAGQARRRLLNKGNTASTSCRIGLAAWILAISILDKHRPVYNTSPVCGDSQQCRHRWTPTIPCAIGAQHSSRAPQTKDNNTRRYVPPNSPSRPPGRWSVCLFSGQGGGRLGKVDCSGASEPRRRCYLVQYLACACPHRGATELLFTRGLGGAVSAPDRTIRFVRRSQQPVVSEWITADATRRRQPGCRRSRSSYFRWVASGMNEAHDEAAKEPQRCR